MTSYPQPAVQTEPTARLTLVPGHEPGGAFAAPEAAPFAGGRLDIVCLSDADWDHVLWTNRQQVMSRLPRVDPAVRVLYVAPPRFLLSGRVVRRGRLRLRHLADKARPAGLWTTQVGERLWVLQPPLPAPNRLLRRHAPWLLARWTEFALRRALRRLDFSAPVLWCYTPLAASLLGAVGERLVCYDVLDDYPTLPEYRALGPRLVAQDRQLSACADLVFVASAKLFEERKALNPNTHFVGNAADVPLFARARSERFPRPAELEGLGTPIIGFHGALASYKLDLDLCRALAQREPGWHFVFIGPVEDRATLQALSPLPNVHLLGAREQQLLPAYLAHFDLCFVPYRHSAYTERLDALKLYECLAAGRPVVARRLPCFVAFEGPVLLADNTDEFLAAIHRVLPPSPPPAPLPLAALERWSWDTKARRLLALVRGRLPDLPSAPRPHEVVAR